MIKKSLLLIAALILALQAGMLSPLDMLQGESAETFLSAQDVLYWCNRGREAVRDPGTPLPH